MRPANMTPMANEIQRTRASAVGFLPKRSQVATKIRPTTLRNDSTESTSAPDPKTIFDRTSEIPSNVPAAIPGASDGRKCSAGGAVWAAADCDRGPDSCPLMLVYRWRSLSDRGLVMDERAGAKLGEQFEQHRMWHLAVEDHHAFDAALQRVDAGFDLGNHAAGNGAVGDQAPRVVDRQLLDESIRLVEHAGHVGQQQE